MEKDALRVLWLQSGGCGGCTMSMLCADTPDLAGMLADAGIRLVWHPSLSLESGAAALRLLESCRDGGTAFDVLCVEGAVLRGPHGSGGFHRMAGSGAPMMRWIADLAGVARHVIAVGSCAAYGGIVSGGGNPTQACGLQYEGDRPGGLLGPRFRAGGGLPVVNVAGCPTHPQWILETLMALAQGRLGQDELDPLGRPRFYADRLVHHGCTRNEFYEFKASAARPSDLGCLMENMGCKGTQAHADCSTRLWNGDGSCLRAGYACIGCTGPGFEEPGHPFHQTPKIAGIPTGLPCDMPKAWFVALSSLSKSATPRRVRTNARSDHPVVTPAIRKSRPE